MRKRTTRLAGSAIALAAAIGFAVQSCSGLTISGPEVTVGQSSCTMLENQLADLQQAALDLLTGNTDSEAWKKMQMVGATVEQALEYIQNLEREKLATKKALDCH